MQISHRCSREMSKQPKAMEKGKRKKTQKRRRLSSFELEPGENAEGERRSEARKQVPRLKK